MGRGVLCLSHLPNLALWYPTQVCLMHLPQWLLKCQWPAFRQSPNKFPIASCSLFLTWGEESHLVDQGARTRITTASPSGVQTWAHNNTCGTLKTVIYAPGSCSQKLQLHCSPGGPGIGSLGSLRDVKVYPGLRTLQSPTDFSIF